VETLDTGKEKDELKARVKELQAQRDELVDALPAFDKALPPRRAAGRRRIHIKGGATKLARGPARFLRSWAAAPAPASGGAAGGRWLT
jgi:hypothetical protein